MTIDHGRVEMITVSGNCGKNKYWTSSLVTEKNHNLQWKQNYLQLLLGVYLQWLQLFNISCDKRNTVIISRDYIKCLYLILRLQHSLNISCGKGNITVISCGKGNITVVSCDHGKTVNTSSGHENIIIISSWQNIKCLPLVDTCQLIWSFNMLLG